MVKGLSGNVVGASEEVEKPQCQAFVLLYQLQCVEPSLMGVASNSASTAAKVWPRYGPGASVSFDAVHRVVGDRLSAHSPDKERFRRLI